MYDIQLEIRTEEGYNGNRWINDVCMEQSGTSVNLDGVRKKSCLRITESRKYKFGEYKFGEYGKCDAKAYLASGCLLDIEIVTPSPYITVEVSNEEVQKDNIEYAHWKFNSSNEFENWVERHSIELVAT
jgi:hypothetical protein